MDKVQIQIDILSSGQNVAKGVADDLKLIGAESKQASGLLDQFTKAIKDLTSTIEGSHARRQQSSAKTADADEKAADRFAAAAKRGADAADKAAERTAAARDRARAKEQAQQEAHDARLAAAAEKAHAAALQRAARFALLPAIGVSGQSLGPLGRAGLGAAGAFGAGEAAGGAGVSSLASGLLATLGPVGIAAAATAVVGGVLTAELFSMTRAAGEDARELQNLASRLGITTVEAQKLSIAAGLVGVNISSLEQSARVLAAGLEDPLGQGKKTAAALREIGVATVTSTGEVRERGPALLDFLTKLLSISSGTERVRLATVTLGRGSKELIPMIENYEELKRVVEQLGGSIKESTTNKLLEADSAIRKMDVSWSLLKRELAAGIAPIVISITGVLTDILQAPGKAKEAVGNVVDQIKGSLTSGPFGGLPRGFFTQNSQFERDANKAADDQILAGQKAADRFAKAQSATEEGLSRRLQEIKKQRDELAIPLSDKGFTDKAARAEKQSQFDELTGEQAGVEARLKAIQKAKSDKESVIRELRSISEQANIAEAGGVERVEARRENLIARMKEQHATQLQINQAVTDFNRIEAAAQVREDEVVRRNRQAGERRVERNFNAKSEALRRHITKSGFGEDDKDSEAQIQADYLNSLADAKEARQAVQDAAGETDPKRRKELIDNANAAEVIQHLDAEYARKQALYDLEKKREDVAAKFKQDVSEAIKTSGRSEILKDFAQAEKLTELKFGHGEGPFAANRAEQDKLTFAQQIYQLDLADAANKKTGSEQQRAALQAILDLKSKDRDAERDHDLKVAEFRKQELDKVRSDAGKLFDAVVGKGPKGAAQFFQAEAKVTGKQVFENVAAELFKGGRGIGLGNLIGGQTEKDAKGDTHLTGIGRILSGTPFGVDVAKLALETNNVVIKDNVVATKDLTQVMKDMKALLTGNATSDGSTEVLPGLMPGLAGTGLPGDPLASSISKAGSLFPGASGIFGTAAASVSVADNIKKAISGDGINTPSVFSQVFKGISSIGAKGGPLGTLFAPSKSYANSDGTESTSTGVTGAERAGAGIATAGALYGGVTGILSGIKQGGGRGITSAIASGTGAAAALDPEPISKAVLAGVALLSGIVGSFFGDPKQARDKQITRDLQKEAYIQPTILNRSTDSSGFTTDHDKYGHARTTGFEGFSSTDPYFVERAGNYYQLPGKVYEPYQKGYTGPAQNQAPPPEVHLHINALDSQSIVDRSHDIGQAIIKELNNGQGIGLAIQQKVLGS